MALNGYLTRSCENCFIVKTHLLCKTGLSQSPSERLLLPTIPKLNEGKRGSFLGVVKYMSKLNNTAFTPKLKLS